MTFPANYAVIAEDELTYVTGGSIVDALPAVMTAENWKTFSTNLVKIVGNSFVGSFVNSVLGGLFGGAYTFGHIGNTISGNYVFATGKTFKDLDLGNQILQVLGGAAAIYTLGSADAKVKIPTTL